MTNDPIINHQTIRTAGLGIRTLVIGVCLVFGIWLLVISLP
jgi:hypothetical protein